MTVKYYASVVDYTSGTVVWSLNWQESSPGVVPYLDSSGLPNGQIGVVFADPAIEGGARGVATITATINGIPANEGITATVSAITPLTVDNTYFTVDNTDLTADMVSY